MRLSGITQESLVDGPGLRLVIFTQGCPHQCPHCHNPESWDNAGGKEYSVRELTRMLKKHKTKKRGVTFSGGEPFIQAAELAELAAAARQMGWNIVTYTGFTYEQLLKDNSNGVKSLLAASDILIDGRYIHELRSMELKFRGSSNQRILNVPETQKKGQIVLWNE